MITPVVVRAPELVRSVRAMTDEERLRLWPLLDEILWDDLLREVNAAHAGEASDPEPRYLVVHLVHIEPLTGGYAVLTPFAVVAP